MPPVSQKQQRFMQAVAHNKGFAKQAGVPQSVGREYGGGQPLNKSLPKSKSKAKAKPRHRSPFARA